MKTEERFVVAHLEILVSQLQQKVAEHLIGRFAQDFVDNALGLCEQF